MGVNEVLLKHYSYCVGQVSVTDGVSLVWLLSDNNLVALCIAIWCMKYITLSCTLCCPLTMYMTANQPPELTLCT